MRMRDVGPVLGTAWIEGLHRVGRLSRTDVFRFPVQGDLEGSEVQVVQNDGFRHDRQLALSQIEFEILKFGLQGGDFGIQLGLGGDIWSVKTSRDDFQGSLDLGLATPQFAVQCHRDRFGGSLQAALLDDSQAVRQSPQSLKTSRVRRLWQAVASTAFQIAF
jgi:hypothetical protein